MGVGHPGRKISRREIERDALVVPDELPVLHVEPADGEREKRVYGRFRRSALGAERRLVRGAVRINNDVHDGMVEQDAVKAELGAEQGNDFNIGNDAVHMRVGNFAGLFASVNGEISDVGA